MKKLLLCFILALFPMSIRGNCTLTEMNFLCNNTTRKDFVRSFYEKSYNKKHISSLFTITIEDSSISQIDNFLNLLEISQHCINLGIKNSSVEMVNNEAFEEFLNLRSLDLSWNKLNNVLFIRHLPVSVAVLNLKSNNIKYVDNVFERLEHLTILDLSNNTITIIDFQSTYWVESLNFSHNLIQTLIPSTSSLRVNTLDLSYNKLKTFSEEELRANFKFLDISHNDLNSVILAESKKYFLSLSGNNNIIKLHVDTVVEIDNVDLSSTNTLLDYNKIRIIPSLLLSLRNNRVENLNKSTLNIFNNPAKIWRAKIDLSNSSIKDISPYYFKGISTPLLNLSNNNLILLKNKVFFECSIGILDLSNSNIQRIQNYTFEKLQVEELYLRKNYLTHTRNIFNDIKIKQLDLSYNKFKTVLNRSFVNCRGLAVLCLEHCLIEKIEPEAFTGLESLQVLSLAYNKLFILEANSFKDLPVRVINLEGNHIDTIRNKTFDNLHNLKALNLSNMSLTNIESYAFNNLLAAEVIDLRYNNITNIPHYFFVNLNNLKAVYLEGNDITTLNPFSNSLKLQNLTLSFKGVFEENQILDLNIRYLHIINSKIDMLKKNCFAGLYNLIELHFKNSYVYLETGALNTLYNLKHLDSKSLFKHTHVIKKNTFSDLKSLENLDLSGLHLRTVETKSFSGMVSLETLLLNNNDLTRIEADTFNGLESLKILDLSYCNIIACSDNSFFGLASLEILHLENNNLVGIESGLLFGNLGNLLELHLGSNNISTLHISSFSNLSNLLHLNLQSNNLNEFPIGVFQYLSSLRVLNLSNNAIQLLKTGALSNLQSLEVLDLSDNELVNLEYVDIFFSLKQLKIVQFDGNHLKQFDFRRFLINLRKIQYVGISNNKWKCDTLSYIIESFNNRSIGYKPKKPVYDGDNIDGVGCVDLCKFVYCSHENVEQNLHYY